jgi:putative FmdB family regulatory protein
MPIFEYKCRGCAHQFELLVLRGGEAACPQCGSRDLEQMLTAFAVSSEGIRQANAKAARRAAVRSKDYIDKKVADAEYVKKHDH